MKNNSRFKYFLVEPSDLAPEATVLRCRLEKIFSAFDLGEMTVAELLFAVIATVCEHRRPGQWWMRGKSEFVFPQKKNFILSAVFKDLGFVIPLESLADFFNNYRIKNLPQSIPRILFLWSTELAFLDLREAPITPLEMLHYQERGWRVVTLSRHCFLTGEVVDGQRDALEFLLHDMTHANLFFSATHQEQKIFFGQLSAALKQNILFPPESLDAELKTALEYIMSDMNSSRPHLEQSLRAALMEHRRRVYGVLPTESLSLEQEQQFQSDWSSFCRDQTL